MRMTVASNLTAQVPGIILQTTLLNPRLPNNFPISLSILLILNVFDDDFPTFEMLAEKLNMKASKIGDRFSRGVQDTKRGYYSLYCST